MIETTRDAAALETTAIAKGGAMTTENGRGATNQRANEDMTFESSGQAPVVSLSNQCFRAFVANAAKAG